MDRFAAGNRIVVVDDYRNPVAWNRTGARRETKVRPRAGKLQKGPPLHSGEMIRRHALSLHYRWSRSLLAIDERHHRLEFWAGHLDTLRPALSPNSRTLKRPRSNSAGDASCSHRSSQR